MVWSEKNRYRFLRFRYIFRPSQNKTAHFRRYFPNKSHFGNEVLTIRISGQRYPDRSNTLGRPYLRDRFPDRCVSSSEDHPDPGPFFCRSFLHRMNLLISSRFIPGGGASSGAVAGTGLFSGAVDGAGAVLAALSGTGLFVGLKTGAGSFFRISRRSRW